MTGEHFATSWISVKGNRWSIYNNSGAGSLPNGAGFKVRQNLPGWGNNNKLVDNSCFNLGPDTYCMEVYPQVEGTYVGCTKVSPPRSAGVCKGCVSAPCK